MPHIVRWMVLVLCIVTFNLSAAEACSTFQLDQGDEIYVGKNYDWGLGDGLIIVNKRGVSKTAMSSGQQGPETGEPASWTSKYGSVTFNQYGRDRAAGGMNEAGLVVESMADSGQDCAYPEPDARPSIYMLQWLQYQLDNFASTDEVIGNDTNVRIRPKKGIHVHYLVTDKKGQSAIIEFVKGKMVTRSGDTMPVKILTNTPYDQDIQCMQQDRIPKPDRFKSTERFIRGAKRLKEFQAGSSKNPKDFAFEILDDLTWSVTKDDWVVNTQWSIVYDVKNLHIYFKTLENPKIRSIDLNRIDFACATPVKILDLNADLSGDVTEKMVLYTRQINRDLIETTFKKTVYLPKFPESVYDAIADYPESFSCQE